MKANNTLAVSETKSEASSFERIIEAETSNEFSNLDSLLQATEKVREKVGEKAGESIPQSTGAVVAQDDQKPVVSLFDISGRIAGLLAKRHPEKIVLPGKKEQQEEIVKALEEEVRRLVKETHKIQNSKKYSPEKLEKMLLRIRSLQKMISEVVHLAAETLAQWYRKYVTKTE